MVRRLESGLADAMADFQMEQSTEEKVKRGRWMRELSAGSAIEPAKVPLIIDVATRRLADVLDAGR
jgi:hypothetical protein